MAKADWVVLDIDTDGALTVACDQCGESTGIPTPTSVDPMVNFAKAFRDLHQRCKDAKPAKKKKGGK